MDICIDFDGTCVTHEFPNVGKDIGAIPILKELINAGHNLILFTMRSGKSLDDAVDWFIDNDITLYGIQSNPTQSSWTSSPKAYGELYIDDAALGCPLSKKPLVFREDEFFAKYKYSPFLSPVQSNGYCYYTPIRQYVNWHEIKTILITRGILKPQSHD